MLKKENDAGRMVQTWILLEPACFLRSGGLSAASARRVPDNPFALTDKHDQLTTRHVIKVLTLSHLFPNPEAPVNGVFVGKLVKALSSHAKTEVIAPISTFPLLRKAGQIPEKARLGKTPVSYPRYLALPKALNDHRWRFFAKAIQPLFEEKLPDADVIHTHWIYPDTYAATLLAGDKPVVATVHGHAAIGLGIGGIETPLIAEALQKAAHLISVSSELKDLMVNDFGVSPEKISILHNGIDPEIFETRSKEDARRNLGLPQNQRIVLTVARLSTEKRIEMLVDAVSKCPSQDFLVYLAGGGPLKEQIQDKIVARGLENRIHLEGPVMHDKVADWYFAADLFCLPSAHEGCPVVIHEALACGLPIVSTRVGAVPDVMGGLGPECGLLCEPDDAAAFSDAIESALNRDWDRNAIAKAGALQTWDKVAEQTIALYENVLEGTSSA